MNPTGKRMLRLALVVYAVVMTLAALSPVRAIWDEFLGPNEAQLLIVSPAAIRNVSVIYDGRPIEQQPGWPTRELTGYAAFPGMRTRVFEPLLNVSWDGPSGPMSVSRSMRQADSGRLCLYVLSLDAAGAPVDKERPDALSPFWWSCYSR